MLPSLPPAGRPFLSSVGEVRARCPGEASLHQDGTRGEQSSQGRQFPFEGVLLFASRYGCLGALSDRRALRLLPPSSPPWRFKAGSSWNSCIVILLLLSHDLICFSKQFIVWFCRAGLFPLLQPILVSRGLTPVLQIIACEI